MVGCIDTGIDEDEGYGVEAAVSDVRRGRGW